MLLLPFLPLLSMLYKPLGHFFTKISFTVCLVDLENCSISITGLYVKKIPRNYLTY